MGEPVTVPPCGLCGAEQTRLGALLFGPPVGDSQVTKRHVCVECHDRIVSRHISGGDSDGGWPDNHPEGMTIEGLMLSVVAHRITMLASGERHADYDAALDWVLDMWRAEDDPVRERIRQAAVALVLAMEATDG